MGLLSWLFGGGTQAKVQLDASQIPVGGMLSGTATITGGKKDHTLTKLQVRLLYVHVEKQDDSPLPKIDTRILVDETIAQAEVLPAGEAKEWSFSIKIPYGTEPSAHNVSYKVLVQADIPGVKDPTAEASLKVVEGAEGGEVASLEELYLKYPGLKARGDDLEDALRDFRNDCYSDREELIAAEPLLARMIREQTGDVRVLALEAWATLLDGQVRKEHIKLLEDLSSDQYLADAMLREVIKAAAMFADEGGMKLVDKFKAHPDAEVRKELADQLRFAAENNFRGKKKLLQELVADTDASVRAAAVGAMSDFRDDKQAMALVLERLEQDDSDDVKAAAIGTLSLVFHHGMLEQQLKAYDAYSTHPSTKVRLEIADNLHWLPEGEAARVRPLIERLLGDADEDVRQRMVFQFRNMSGFKDMAGRVMEIASSDPSSDVRGEAIGSLGNLLEPEALFPYYERLLQGADRSTTYSVLGGLYDHRQHPHGRALLQAIANGPHEDPAESARSYLEIED
jgi:hypothetical protein